MKLLAVGLTPVRVAVAVAAAVALPMAVAVEAVAVPVALAADQEKGVCERWANPDVTNSNPAVRQRPDHAALC